jgi:hypothetical protein
VFDERVLTRRLRLRRLRRSTVRFARTLNPPPGIPDFDNMLDELCVWAASMPWVIESPCGARERLRLFMLKCTPLSCHEHWFAINAIDDNLDDGPGIFVILQDAVVDRATAIGCGAGVEAIGKGRSITAIGLPTSEKELRELQHLLRVTYTTAFGTCN